MDNRRTIPYIIVPLMVMILLTASTSPYMIILFILSGLFLFIGVVDIILILFSSNLDHLPHQSKDRVRCAMEDMPRIMAQTLCKHGLITPNAVMRVLFVKNSVYEIKDPFVAIDAREALKEALIEAQKKHHLIKAEERVLLKMMRHRHSYDLPIMNGHDIMMAIKNKD